MQQTPPALSSRRAPRSVIFATLVASSAALLLAGGCTSEDPGSLSGVGAASGTGVVAGSSSGGRAGAAASGGIGGASVATAGAGGIAPFAGSSSSSGGNGGPSGGVTSGGMTSGGAAGSAAKPCVDVQPPPSAEWPDATCENWATETTECTKDWFAKYCDVSCGRCKPEGGGGGSGGGPAAVDCSTKGLPNVTGGNGFATRYWDCCQPHCAQFDGHRCNQDGTSRTGNTQSSCSGGGSFACYDESPKAVNECLSYGYIAKANPNCGQCYRIQFTGEGQHNVNDPGSKLIKGKQMIVKVSNTGGDVANNQFDMMIPGGGVGQFNACSKQWGSTDLGAQYGGFLANCSGAHSAKKECVRQNCMKIPAGAARDGCLWFVDWFQVADNPKFTSQQTDCPF